jgi:cytochrome c556
MRWPITTGALTALTACILWTASAGAQNGKTPSVKEVMKKINYRDTALCPSLGKMLKADAPNWDEIQKDVKQIVANVEELPKNDPPRGDRTNWNKLTGDYLADAKALDAAVQRKDKSGALAAHAKIANPAYCTACHKAHRNQ